MLVSNPQVSHMGYFLRISAVAIYLYLVQIIVLISNMQKYLALSWEYKPMDSWALIEPICFCHYTVEQDAGYESHS